MAQTDPARTASMLLHLSEADNVMVATGPLRPGMAQIVGGGEIHLSEAVTLGHKVATRHIAAGEAIIKYGVPIGVATQDVSAGTHVHVHNIRSDYTPTHVLAETAKGGRNA